MRGRFVLWPNTPKQLIVPNLVTAAGERLYADVLWRGEEATELPNGYYVGLCNNNIDRLDDLTDLLEPSGAGGYARKQLLRNTTDWPAQPSLNGAEGVQSKVLTWTPSGAAFSLAISRLFLCNVAAGTVGTLIAYSGTLATAEVLADGVPFPAVYEGYIR